MLDPNTEVEGGETMDQVNMAQNGGKRDYFFSDHLKKDGMSYAQHHKHILQNGGNQNDINMLAKMQEVAAGRDPNKVQTANLGGPKKFETGGTYPKINGKEMTQRQKDFHDQSLERGMVFSNGRYFKSEEAAQEWRNEQDGMQISDGTNPYKRDTPEYEMFEKQKETAEEDGLVYIVNPNRASSGKWVKKEDADKEIEISNVEQKKEDDAIKTHHNNKNKSSSSSGDPKRENKYNVASYEAYGDLEGEFGTVPDYQLDIWLMMYKCMQVKEILHLEKLYKRL